MPSESQREWYYTSLRQLAKGGRNGKPGDDIGLSLFHARRIDLVRALRVRAPSAIQGYITLLAHMDPSNPSVR